MNTKLAGQTHGIHHRPFPMDWKIGLAGAGIAIPAGIGLYYTVLYWLQGEIELGLIAIGSFVGPAVTYAFGYFRCLPEVLGSIERSPRRTSLRRWSDFALLATFVDLLIIVFTYSKVIWVNFSYISAGRAVAVVVASTCLLPTWVMATEQYLGWTMPYGETRRATGWRVLVRRVLGRTGGRLLSMAGTRRASLIGGGLAMLSLFLVVKSDIFGPEYTGYQVVAGTRNWYDIVPNGAEGFITEVRRGMYAMGLAVAAVASVRAIAGPWAKLRRGNRVLTMLAGTIALFEMMDLGTTTIDSYSPHVRLSLWILLWIAPIAIWVRFVRRGNDQQDHARLAIMVYYLPIFLLGVAYLPFIAYLALGYGSFLLGMLLVWWGLLQSQREIAQEQDQHSRKIA